MSILVNALKQMDQYYEYTGKCSETDGSVL